MIDTSGGAQTSQDVSQPPISTTIDEQLENRTATVKVKRPNYNKEINSVLKDLENLLASDESDDSADNNLAPQASKSKPKVNLAEIGIQTAEEYIEVHIEQSEEEKEEEGVDTLQQLTQALNLELEPQQQNYVDYFKPDVKLSLIIGNFDYSPVRDHPDKGFADLHEAKADADNFEKKILEYEFQPANVTKLYNINLQQIKNQMKKYRKALSANSEAGQKTLVVIYFAGHGVMQRNENNIVVLESEKTKQFYPLEFQSRALSKIKGSYIITIFDCCRENMPLPVKKTRGSGEYDDGEDDPVPEDKLHSDTSYIQINGCPPNKFVDAYSFISSGFFDILDSIKKANNKTVLIPDKGHEFIRYSPNGVGSLSLEIAEPLLLNGPDPEDDQMPKVLALNEKLKGQIGTLEDEKKLLEERAKAQEQKAEEAQQEQVKLEEEINAIQEQKVKIESEAEEQKWQAALKQLKLTLKIGLAKKVHNNQKQRAEEEKKQQLEALKAQYQQSSKSKEDVINELSSQIFGLQNQLSEKEHAETIADLKSQQLKSENTAKANALESDLKTKLQELNGFEAQKKLDEQEQTLITENLAIELEQSINQANIAENKAQELENEAQKLNEKIVKLQEMLENLKLVATEADQSMNVKQLKQKTKIKDLKSENMRLKEKVNQLSKRLNATSQSGPEEIKDDSIDSGSTISTAVSYDRLSLTTDKDLYHGSDSLIRLLDKGEDNDNMVAFRTNEGPGELTINVDKSIILTSYGLKSGREGNEQEKPKQWEFVAVHDNGKEQVIHKMEDETQKWDKCWQWNKWEVTTHRPCRKFILRFKTNHGHPRYNQISQLVLYEKRRTKEIVYEKLGRRINYADGLAYIESVGGRPVTQDELRDKIQENGRPLYPNERQWAPIWINYESQKPDWMQIGEGEGDAGTSHLEKYGSLVSRHTEAGNYQNGSNDDWNVTVVYWKSTQGRALDQQEPEEIKDDSVDSGSSISTAVSYDRLSISVDKSMKDGRPEYILDTKETSSNVADFLGSGQPVTITLTVDEPIILTSYGLKTTDGDPNAQPRLWEFVAVQGDENEQVIHKMDDEARKWDNVWQWKKWEVTTHEPTKKFILRLKKNHGGHHHYQLGQLVLYEQKRTGQIVHERLDHRINYADGIAYIESIGGRPVTREELRNKLKENGRAFYPNELQWTPIWVDYESQQPDWMQIGDGNSDSGPEAEGTSFLEKYERLVARHTDASIEGTNSSDWNVTVVYWKPVKSKGLEKKYFHQHFGNFKQTLFCYDPKTKSSSRLQISDEIDMQHRMVIQVRDTLFAIGHSGKSLWKLTNMSDGTIIKNVLAEQLTNIGGGGSSPAITVFNERYLFKTGGSDTPNNVEYYNIARNQWFQAPAMNEGRYDHSSCCLKEQLYVFGGKTPRKDTISSIDASQVTSSSNNSAQWVDIQVGGQLFTPRTDLSVAPISLTEIIIMGGSIGGKAGDAYKFDVQTKEMSKLLDEDFKHYNINNQSIKSKPGQVVALVSDNQNSLSMIAYNQGASSITEVENIGAWR